MLCPRTQRSGTGGSRTHDLILRATQSRYLYSDSQTAAPPRSTSYVMFLILKSDVVMVHPPLGGPIEVATPSKSMTSSLWVFVLMWWLLKEERPSKYTCNKKGDLNFQKVQLIKQQHGSNDIHIDVLGRINSRLTILGKSIKTKRPNIIIMCFYGSSLGT